MGCLIVWVRHPMSWFAPFRVCVIWFGFFF
jgi:hypothetical protein